MPISVQDAIATRHNHVLPISRISYQIESNEYLHTDPAAFHHDLLKPSNSIRGAIGFFYNANARIDLIYKTEQAARQLYLIVERDIQGLITS